MALNQKAHNDAIVAQLEANPELIKDKLWRMNNLYWIVTKDKTREVFTMNRAQLDFFTKYLAVLNPYHRHIILKSRQLGFTTFIDIFMLDEILFNTNREGIVIAHKIEDAKEIFDRKIDFAVRNMADDIKEAFFKLQRNSARKIQVIVDYGPDKGSTSSMQVSTSGRSGTFHLVHISEFAKLCVTYPKRAEEVEGGTFPAVPLDGFIFIESTAEGMAGRFYEIFQENWLTRLTVTPQLSRVTFLPHFYNWQWDDMELKKITEEIPVASMLPCEIDWGEYQKEHELTNIEITYYYMKWMQLGKNMNRLKQEFPTTVEEAFLATGQTYFPTSRVASQIQRVVPGTVGEMILNIEGKYEFRKTPQGRLEVFEMPIRGEKYVIGGDTAEGLAHGDAQVLYVLSHKTKKCVAIYRSQEPPDEFITSAYQLGQFYNWAILAVEVNKDGLWVNSGLEKLGYINLYYRRSFDDITKHMTKNFGWKTTSATRPFALAALRAVFLQLNDGFPMQMLTEMLTFVRNAKGKAEAMDGKHDDVIMAGSIAYAVLEEMGTYTENKVSGERSVMSIMFGETQ